MYLIRLLLFIFVLIFFSCANKAAKNFDFVNSEQQSSLEDTQHNRAVAKTGNMCSDLFEERDELGKFNRIKKIVGSYGNFFQKSVYRSTEIIDWNSQFLTQIGIKTRVEKNIIQLPKYDYRKDEFATLKLKNWSIERPESSDSIYGNFVMDVKFGLLTHQQFDQLAVRYPFNSNLIYHPEKNYSIVDFLPQSAQALYGKYYISNRYNFPEKKMSWVNDLMPSDTFNQISRVTNCFQAAWEFIRNPKKDLFVFFASEEAVKRTFEDANYSSVVKKLGPKQVRQLILNPQEVLNSTRPGDLVLIYMKMQSMAQGEFEALAHVSTIVEGNIVFEKQNPGSSYPYRLALASDSLLELASGDSSLETLKDFRVVIRRFNKKTLPSPQEAFNMQTAPGSFINIGHLDPAKAPSLDFQKNHSVVSELGSGGTIINESFYKIEKISVDHLLKAQP